MFYKTHEVAKMLPNYSSSRTLLKALHNNQKAEKKNKTLSKIWDCRRRFGKCWGFVKTDIDLFATGLIDDPLNK